MVVADSFFITRILTQTQRVNLTSIVSRASKASKDHYEFMVSCDKSDSDLEPTIEMLKMKMNADVKVLSREPTNHATSQFVTTFCFMSFSFKFVYYFTVLIVIF